MLKVGDVIKSEDQANELPVGTVIHAKEAKATGAHGTLEKIKHSSAQHWQGVCHGTVDRWLDYACIGGTVLYIPGQPVVSTTVKSEYTVGQKIPRQDLRKGKLPVGSVVQNEVYLNQYYAICETGACLAGRPTCQSNGYKSPKELSPAAIYYNIVYIPE